MINPLSVILGVTGIVFFGLGWIQFKNPPHRSNIFYGYRTSASMRSQESWEFAQLESAKAVMQAGGILVLIAIPCLFWGIDSWPGLFLAILILVAAVIYVFWRVQGRLRKRFGP